MKNKILKMVMGFAMVTQMITAQVPSYVPVDGLVGWWGSVVMQTMPVQMQIMAL